MPYETALGLVQRATDGIFKLYVQVHTHTHTSVVARCFYCILCVYNATLLLLLQWRMIPTSFLVFRTSTTSLDGQRRRRRWRRFLSFPYFSGARLVPTLNPRAYTDRIMNALACCKYNPTRIIRYTILLPWLCRCCCVAVSIKIRTRDRSKITRSVGMTY